MKLARIDGLTDFLLGFTIGGLVMTTVTGILGLIWLEPLLK